MYNVLKCIKMSHITSLTAVVEEALGIDELGVCPALYKLR